MYEAILKTGWDALLFAVPCVAILLLGFLRLDGVVAVPKRSAGHRRAVCGEDEDGQPIMSDPDGRRWNRTRHRE